MSEPIKAFDPMAQFAEMASLWTTFGNPFRTLAGALPVRFEGLDPTVQEIAVLAAMHNMASMLKNPENVKATLSAEIAERAKRLAERQ